MRRHYFNVLLVVVALAGAYSAITTSQLLRKARVEHRRVVQMAGTLRIHDPDDIWYVRFRSAQPGEFAWRFYVPTTPSSGPQVDDVDETLQESDEDHFVARVRFAYSPAGSFVVYTRLRNGWQLHELGPPELANFVRDHWSELVVEQSGRPFQEHFKPGTRQTLLRVMVPEHLTSAASKQLGKELTSQLLPVLFEWRIGPDL